jgi:hypothetical protein
MNIVTKELRREYERGISPLEFLLIGLSVRREDDGKSQHGHEDHASNDDVSGETLHLFTLPPSGFLSKRNIEITVGACFLFAALPPERQVVDLLCDALHLLFEFGGTFVRDIE